MPPPPTGSSAETAPAVRSPRPAAARTGGAVLSVRGASLGYHGTPVLSGVDWEVGPGELVGLVGPSGAGKTTLLRALAGAPVRLRGDVEVLGRPVGRADARRELGYVPQLETVDRDFPLTVRQVVLLGRADRSSRTPWFRASERREADRVLERLGIGDLAGRTLAELSGGQLQRMYLARALVRGAKVLLLDEPTSGVDPATRQRVLGLLAELRAADGLTIVLTTHDLNFVASHLPRITCLSPAGVVADGSPSRILTRDVLETTYGTAMRVLRDGDRVVVVDEVDPLARGPRPVPTSASPVADEAAG